MFKMMPNVSSVTQPITKIFNPIQSSLLNPFNYDEYYPVPSAYGGFSHTQNQTHLASAFNGISGGFFNGNGSNHLGADLHSNNLMTNDNYAQYS